MASRHSLGHLTNAGFSDWSFESNSTLLHGVSELGLQITTGQLSKAMVRQQTKESGLCDRERYLDDFCVLLERIS